MTTVAESDLLLCVSVTTIVRLCLTTASKSSLDLTTSSGLEESLNSKESNDRGDDDDLLTLYLSFAKSPASASVATTASALPPTARFSLSVAVYVFLLNTGSLSFLSVMLMMQEAVSLLPPLSVTLTSTTNRVLPSSLSICAVALRRSPTSSNTFVPFPPVSAYVNVPNSGSSSSAVTATLTNAPLASSATEPTKMLFLKAGV